jgi:hypothetical protein
VETTGIIDERSAVPPETEKQNAEAVSANKEKTAELETEDPAKKVGVVVTENIPAATETSTPPRRRAGRRTPPRRTPPAAEATTPPAETAPKTPPARTRRGRAAAAAKPPVVKEPDPLEKVNLIILFKDGTAIERPMSEVLRFTVDKGVLTVISKDGRIGRYAILDVARVTIE